MADKRLSESEWIKVSKGKGFKDAALRKALVALDKAREPAVELEAVAELQKQATALKRDAKNDKSVLEFLADMGKAADKCQADAEAAAKAASRQGEHDKKAAEDDEDPAVLTTNLKSMLQQVQRGATLFAMIVTDGGKQTGAMLSHRPMAPAKAKVIKDYLGLSAAKPPLLGTCVWEARAVTFVVDSKVTGLAKKLVVSLLAQTGMRWKVRVRGDDPDDVDGDEEDEGAAHGGPAGAATHAAPSAKPPAPPPEGAPGAVADAASAKPVAVDARKDREARRGRVRQARAVWVKTKTQAEADLEKVKDGARMMYIDDAGQYPRVVEGCKSIDAILDTLDNELRDTLDKFAAAPLDDDARLQSLTQTAEAVLDRYLGYVKSDPLLRAIDLGEFAKVQVHAPILKTLTALREALG